MLGKVALGLSLALLLDSKAFAAGDPAAGEKIFNGVCKACHDTLVQREEARGYTIGADIDGRPVDPNHPWNR